MGGGRENPAVPAAVARLRREDCGRTKHDSAFSDWKVLIGPSDWEDYSMGKEGAARYRVHNLPTSSSPGLYELGTAVSRNKSGREIRKLDPSYVIVVYIGQADSVRTRLQQYGRSGAHLSNCSSSDRRNDHQRACTNKKPGLFNEILSRGHSIVFRWAPMNNKADALRMEALLLNTFDYAWNKGSNGARRPNDILQKLEEASSTTYRVSSITKKLLPFLQKKVGIKIQGKAPSLETQFATHAEEEHNFLYGIFKFSRSNPRVVLDRSCFSEGETGSCGVHLGDGSICKRPPVKGRKRCADHKGLKVNVLPRAVVPNEQGVTDEELRDLMFHEEKVPLGSLNRSASESFSQPICGFILGDGSSCREPPVQGRKRCEEHKGRRIVTLNPVAARSRDIDYAHIMGEKTSSNIEVGKVEVQILSEKGDTFNNIAAVCGVDYGDGTFCTREPARGRVRCDSHKGMRELARFLLPYIEFCCYKVIATEGKSHGIGRPPLHRQQSERDRKELQVMWSCMTSKSVLIFEQALFSHSTYVLHRRAQTSVGSAMPGGERWHPAAAAAAERPPEGEDEAFVWSQIKAEARRDAEQEPALASYLYSTILSHSSLPRSISFHLGNKLCSSTLLSTLLYDLFLDFFSSDADLRSATVADLRAARVRDPACVSFSHCLLNYKGFLACQAQRVAHRLWNQSRRSLALALQSRISDVFAVDIHPAAKIGKGVLFDHATGVVVGETAVIGNNVSILHHVTLGGTGKVGGDRHPKIGDGVLIGAGATILGNVKIGEGAKIGAGSMVLIDVPPQTTAVGNPARLVGGKDKPKRHEECPGETMDHTFEWSDYII